MLCGGHANIGEGDYPSPNADDVTQFTACSGLLTRLSNDGSVPL